MFSSIRGHQITYKENEGKILRIEIKMCAVTYTHAVRQLEKGHIKNVIVMRILCATVVSNVHYICLEWMRLDVSFRPFYFNATDSTMRCKQDTQAFFPHQQKKKKISEIENAEKTDQT